MVALRSNARAHQPKHGISMVGILIYLHPVSKRLFRQKDLKLFKKKKVNGLWLPFFYEVFGDFAAVAWSNLDFPAAEFFDFAADS